MRMVTILQSWGKEGATTLTVRTLEPFGPGRLRPRGQRSFGMTLDDGTDSFTCQHCATQVNVSDFCRPVSDRVRDADDYGPRRYIIIGRDRVLHSCELPEDL